MDNRENDKPESFIVKITRQLEEANKKLDGQNRLAKEKREVEKATWKQEKERMNRRLEESLRSATEVSSIGMKTAFDVARGGYTTAEKKLAAQRIRDAGILVEGNNEIILTQLGTIKYGLGQIYGDEIRVPMARFIREWPVTENIFVVQEGMLQEASNLVRGLHITLTNAGGVHMVDSGLVLLSDPKNKSADAALKIKISEELIHAFLKHTSKKPLIPGATDISNMVRFALSSKDSWNEDTLYYSDPNEQVAKALVLSSIRASGNYNPFETFNQNNLRWYYESAQKGQKRIDELGIGQILKGNLRTNHEQDFIVNVPDQTR